MEDEFDFPRIGEGVAYSTATFSAAILCFKLVYCYSRSLLITSDGASLSFSNTILF